MADLIKLSTGINFWNVAALDLPQWLITRKGQLKKGTPSTEKLIVETVGNRNEPTLEVKL